MPRELQINNSTTVGRASLILALMIGVSRLTGFGRLIVASYFFGRGAQTDAYNAAFNIPDTLAILISGGLLATGFVPVFTRYLSSGDSERARRTFRALLTLMLVGFGGITLILFGLTFTPLGTLLAPDKIGPGNVEKYLLILRILLAAQWLFVVGGVFSGTFNALRLFWFPALQPVFYNVGIIVGGVLGARAGIEYQAWGALGGAFVGTIVMLAPAARHHGLSLRPLWDLADEGVRRVMVSLLPIFLGLASGQIIALNLPRAFAKALAVGSVTSLDNANRLMQVPLDLLASSAAVALFPTISRLWIEDKPDELRASFDQALAKNISAMLFAAAMTIVLAPSLVHLLLERGAFNARDARETAFVLQCYALCLPALGAQQLLARGFFATDRAGEPVAIGFLAMALFLALGAVAIRFPLPGGAGLALAAAVSTSVLSGLLWRALQKHLNLDGKVATRALGRGLLVALASAGAAALGVALIGHLVARFDTDLTPQLIKLAARALVVIVGGGLGAGVWVMAGRIIFRRFQPTENATIPHIMQRSKVEIFVHMVWATHQRQHFVLPRHERAIYACIHQETLRMHSEVLALNGMPDHVHLVAKLHSTVCVAKLAQSAKGVSSRLANDELGFEGAFDWQDHYSAFSVSRSHLKRVIRYVERQKERHASNNLWDEWEETEMERPFDAP